MKISEYFNLRRTQFELDFIDIDIEKDTPLFLDPYYLGLCNFKWAIDANRTLESFFSILIQKLKNDRPDEAKAIFSHLKEPNETHLGLSKGKSQGRGVGPQDTINIFDNLVRSKAMTTGVVEDLEDFRIFVDGVGRDKISDLTTNIIKKHLIEYTQNQCKLWNIPIQDGILSGFFWDRMNQEWKNEYSSIPLVNGNKVLLVPKRIVSYSSDYTPEKYLQHFVLNFLQEDHLTRNTSLVQVRRNKKGKITRKYVTKKSVRNSLADISKDYLASFTKKYPEIFEKFKLDTTKQVRNISNEELTSDLLTKIIDHLIIQIDEIKPGNEAASRYHKLTVGILELLFYPNITSPIKEREIHEGRKRIDITFDNAAETGFFFRIVNTYQIPSPFIIVECKNYSRDVKNPELDQISSRFSPNRGKFGLILCRDINKMEKFIKRCRDTYHDQRGLIIPIVDNDLLNMLMNYEKGGIDYCENILQERFRDIALS